MFVTLHTLNISDLSAWNDDEEEEEEEHPRCERAIPDLGIKH